MYRLSETQCGQTGLHFKLLYNLKIQKRQRRDLVELPKPEEIDASFFYYYYYYLYYVNNTQCKSRAVLEALIGTEYTLVCWLHA